jgi:hypothetical protein
MRQARQPVHSVCVCCLVLFGGFLSICLELDSRIAWPFSFNYLCFLWDDHVLTSRWRGRATSTGLGRASTTRKNWCEGQRAWAIRPLVREFYYLTFGLFTLFRVHVHIFFYENFVTPKRTVQGCIWYDSVVSVVRFFEGNGYVSSKLKCIFGGYVGTLGRHYLQWHLCTL